MLDRHVERLKQVGVKRIVVNASHLADQIQSFVDRKEGAVELVCSFEREPLGTAGAVRKALHLLAPGPFLVVYGDVLLEAQFSELVAAHEGTGGVATLGAHEVSDARGKGVVSVDVEGRVTEFVEKAPTPPSPALVNAGVYVLEPSLIAALPPGRYFDFGYDVLPAAIRCGQPLFAHVLSGRVIDVGTPDGLASARALCAGHAIDANEGSV